ncbi:MAG: CsbD family protein [Gemmataceae bacterium]|nr:CsbD family protein [Gemmataceae bacterium]
MGGRWEQVVGKAKQIWGAITDDAALQAKGDYERFVGLLKEKTGQTREDIEARLTADE